MNEGLRRFGIDDRCPECGGALECTLLRDQGCSCHISPPCPACSDPQLSCTVCDWQTDREGMDVAPEPPPESKASGDATASNLGSVDAEVEQMMRAGGWLQPCESLTPASWHAIYVTQAGHLQEARQLRNEARAEADALRVALQQAQTEAGADQWAKAMREVEQQLKNVDSARRAAEDLATARRLRIAELVEQLQQASDARATAESAAAAVREQLNNLVEELRATRAGQRGFAPASDCKVTATADLHGEELRLVMRVELEGAVRKLTCSIPQGDRAEAMARAVISTFLFGPSATLRR